MTQDMFQRLVLGTLTAGEADVMLEFLVTTVATSIVVCCYYDPKAGYAI